MVNFIMLLAIESSILSCTSMFCITTPLQFYLHYFLLTFFSTILVLCLLHCSLLYCHLWLKCLFWSRAYLTFHSILGPKIISDICLLLLFWPQSLPFVLIFLPTLSFDNISIISMCFQPPAWYSGNPWDQEHIWNFQQTNSNI